MTTYGPGETALRAHFQRKKDASQPPPETPLKLQLFAALCEFFNEEELHTLCFVLGVDYDSLPGDNKLSKARELVTHYLKNNDLESLRNAMQQQNDKVEL